MSDAHDSRFVIRDRNWHPKALTPDYKTSILRSPRQALVSIPQSLSESSGPDFSHLKMGLHGSAGVSAAEHKYDNRRCDRDSCDNRNPPAAARQGARRHG